MLVSVKGFEFALGFGVGDGEGVRPLSLYTVQHVLWPSFSIYRCGEGCLLPAQPSSAGVVDFGGETGGGLNVAALA